MTNRIYLVLIISAVLTCTANAQANTNMTDPTKTTYGQRNQNAPKELDVFSFLIGTWEGRGKTKLDDGKVAEYTVTWIGRYILDGTAIADECHGPAPDGSPYLGINLRPVRSEQEDLDCRVLERIFFVLAKTGRSSLGVCYCTWSKRDGCVGIAWNVIPRAL
jgi:hypothetical protein